MAVKQLASKWRPTSLVEVVGNEDAKKLVKQQLTSRSAHAFLIYGPSGCGKTTIAALLAKGFSKNTPSDISEINAGATTGIDKAREVIDSARYRPQNTCRVILVEEAHALTTQAQKAFLRPIEDPPHEDVVFLFVTDQPHLLPKQFTSRLYRIAVEAPSEEEVRNLLLDIIDAETSEGAFKNASEEDLEDLATALTEASNCIPREAISMLQVALDLGGTVQQAIESATKSDIDESVFAVYTAIHSGEDPEKRMKVITKHIDCDTFALVNKLLFLNHCLMRLKLDNPLPVSHFFATKIKRLPPVESMHAFGIQLCQLKRTMTENSVPPEQLVYPILLRMCHGI